MRTAGKAAAAVVAVIAALTAGCGGTLEDDYRRGRFDPDDGDPGQEPESSDDGSAQPGAGAAGREPGSILVVGETTAFGMRR